VPIRAPLPRVLLWAGLLLCGLIAVVGGLALRGPEVVAVGVAGVLAACMAAGIARESPAGYRRRSTLEAAASAGASTVGALLLVAGIAAMAGGSVAALTVAAVFVVVLVVQLVRGRSRAARRTTADGSPVAYLPSAERPARTDARAEPARLLPPVSTSSTAELGREWIRTAAVLAGRLDPVVRESLVARREEALDELERRDPAGFARWLAAGPTLTSDPSGYVKGGPLRGDPAADTDAA
jgi:hypothetical protein